MCEDPVVGADDPIRRDARLLADPMQNPFVQVGDDSILEATYDEIEAWTASRPIPPAVVGVLRDR